MADTTQTLRVRMTGSVTGLLAAVAAARGAIRSVSDDTNRGRGPVRALTDGLARLGVVMRGVSVVATPALVAGAIPGVLALAAALAQAAGAGLLLPAALLGAVTVVGALAIATSGFGEALKNVGDPVKFAEAIAKLTPSARAAAIAVQGLKKPFDDLRNSLQERLFTGLAGRITALGLALMTNLRPALLAVTSTANRTFAGILTDFTSVRRQADLSGIANNSARAFDNLLRAVRPLLGVFIDVAAVGASFLPKLTAGAGSAAQRFADLVARMRQAGELAAMIQRGLDTLRQLGQLASNVGGILSGVFRAANVASGGLLNTLITVTGAIKDVVNSTAGQTALRAFFATLSTIAATFGATLRTLAPVLATVLTNLQIAIQRVAPSIQPLAAAFGQVLVSLAPLLPLLAQIAIVVAGQLTIGLTVLKPLLDALVVVLDFLGPVLVPVVASLITMKIAMLALAPVLAVGSAAIGTVTTAWKLLSLAFAASPIGFVLTLLVALVAGLVIAYQTSDRFRAIVNGAFQAVSNTVSSAVSYVTGLLSGLARFFGDVGRSAYNGLVSGVSNAITYVASMPTRIYNALGNLGNLLLRAGWSIMDGLARGIRLGINNALNAAWDALSAIRNLFPFSPAKEGPFSGRGYTTFSGAALITDMARGIRAAQPVLTAAAAAALSSAQQRLSSATVTPLAAARVTGGAAALDPAELAAVIGAELRAVFANGVRTDMDFQGLTLRVNAVNRGNARR